MYVYRLWTWIIIYVDYISKSFDLFLVNFNRQFQIHSGLNSNFYERNVPKIFILFLSLTPNTETDDAWCKKCNRQWNIFKISKSFLNIFDHLSYESIDMLKTDNLLVCARAKRTFTPWVRSTLKETRRDFAWAEFFF